MAVNDIDTFTKPHTEAQSYDLENIWDEIYAFSENIRKAKRKLYPTTVQKQILNIVSNV
jgi:hypothetical protein